MAGTDVPMSQASALILATLGPHTRDHVLTLLRACPGLTLTSGRRSHQRNRAVGGSPRSFHLDGRAADFTGTEAALQAGADAARQQRLGRRCTGPEEVLVHDVGTGRHLHVAW